MNAELLREAAALMRERAEATNLTTDDGDVAGWHTIADLVGMFEEAGDGGHIASWHPAVALAVADWLEVTARDVGTSSIAYHAAVAVARAFLGRDQ